MGVLKWSGLTCSRGAGEEKKKEQKKEMPLSLDHTKSGLPL